jgi:hypothetical protein
LIRSDRKRDLNLVARSVEEEEEEEEEDQSTKLTDEVSPLL